MRLHARIAIVALSSLAAAAFSACSRSTPHAERGNVILIVIDGLRADHLTPYGYSRNTSPFLDELASRSVLFENAISQSSWTKTSVASLLTSLYPDAHGVRSPTDVLPASARILPEVLQEHGYRTFAIHGNPWLEERFGFDQGFDDFRFTHWNKETFDAEKLNDQALRWLEENSGPPFFLYLHYMDVHTPWKPPRSSIASVPRTWTSTTDRFGTWIHGSGISTKS